MTKWPHDDPASLAAFYGNPDSGEPGRQLVPVVPPFVMYYDGKPIAHIMFHRKAAAALMAALLAIWIHYGRDQQKIDALGISNFCGSYNPRMIRGSATRWSNHAYGAAIDLNAGSNGFNSGHGTMPQPVVDAFKEQGALWGGDYHGRTDPMHFEFCSRGGSAHTVSAPVQTPVVLPTRPMPPVEDDSPNVEPLPVPAAINPSNPNVEHNEAVENTAWYWKLWSWISGGGIASLSVGGSLFSGVSPSVIAIVVGALLIVFCIVWFTKKGNGW